MVGVFAATTHVLSALSGYTAVCFAWPVKVSWRRGWGGGAGWFDLQKHVCGDNIKASTMWVAMYRCARVETALVPNDSVKWYYPSNSNEIMQVFNIAVGHHSVCAHL